MAVTRRQIRQAIIDLKQWPQSLYGTLSEDTGTTKMYVVAASLGYAGQPLAKFMGRTLYMPDAQAAGDVERACGEFQGASRRLNHLGPAFTNAPATGDYFEVTPFKPDVINEAIERALTRQCFTLERVDIVTDGSTTYTVGTAPFNTLTGVENFDDQVVGIDQLTGDAGASEIVSRWDRNGRTFEAVRDGTVETVVFHPAPSGTIRVAWRKPYAALADDNTTTTACPLEWVVNATLYELYAGLERQAVMDQRAATHWRGLKLAVEVEMSRERRKVLGEYGSRIRAVKVTRRYGAPAVGLNGNGLTGGDPVRAIW